MIRWRVLRGRIERWAAHYHGPHFHALLCDPPYELGFMGRDWDKSGVSFNPETWAALAEHLYPGAFGMAFASSRGWHRLACAIKDAGLGDMPQAVGHNIGTNACARCGRRVKHNGSGVGCECGAQRETIKLPTGRNPHPAVKPLTLCKWLATLLLPPQEYAPRRILVPFAGSGSEMIGALLADWEWILGIEMLAENVALAEARLAWWADKSRWGQTDPAVLLRERESDDGQLELWSV